MKNVKYGKCVRCGKTYDADCYGEFTQTQEPCQVGADIAVGSLIKNPGGGIADPGREGKV